MFVYVGLQSLDLRLHLKCFGGRLQGRNKVYEIRDQRFRGGIRDHSPGITTLGIGISSVYVESGIKIVNIFGIRDQNSQCFCDQGLKFSTFL